MSRRMRGRPQPEPSGPLLPSTQAIVILQRQVDRGKEMIAASTIEEAPYHAWQNNVREYLKQAFGPASDNVRHVVAAGLIDSLGGGGDYTPHYKDALRSQIALLDGCLEQLREKTIPWNEPAPRVTPGTYDVAQICHNGHVGTTHLRAAPVHDAPYCRECGAPTIKACPACVTPIRGHYSYAALMPYERPGFCHQCGAAYPWTASALAAANAWADQLEAFSFEDRNAVSEDLPDLVRDTARTPVAASRFKRILAKAGIEGATGFKQILVSVVTEAAKRILWP